MIAQINGAPPKPLETLPPRVCWATTRQVHNPVCSFSTPEPLCGRATRKDMDAVTSDREIVSCEECKALLAVTPDGQEPKSRAPAAVPSIPAGMAWQHPAGNFSQVLEALDTEKIEERLKELKGEQEALKVLLKAAKARDKARQEPVTESE